jgi:hypothetical protein
MKLASVAIAALLILPPAYAAKKAHVAHPPAKECISIDAITSSSPSAYTLVARLEGDQLAAFEERAAKHISEGSEAIPSNVSTILAYRDGDVSVLIAFKDGCASGAGSLATKLLAKLLDDGSI